MPSGQHDEQNAIRPSAVGKKNFLFPDSLRSFPFGGTVSFYSPEAGERSAILYSIIVSCERHGVAPLAYLRDILRKLPAMSNQQKLTALLPDQWKPS